MDRKLATIFASDVVGFSKMMGRDEVKTLEILRKRREVIDNIIDELANFSGVLEVGSNAYDVIATVPVFSTKTVSQEIGFEQRLLQYGFFGWLLLAFLGGMILNLMPCVLPVLSLKIISFLKDQNINRKTSSLLTIAGIFTSIWRCSEYCSKIRSCC